MVMPRRRRLSSAGSGLAAIEAALPGSKAKKNGAAKKNGSAPDSVSTQ
jgi:hypothetical protein